MSSTPKALAATIDVLVSTRLEGLGIEQLQALITPVAREQARLSGWLNVAAGQLAAVSDGQVPTDEGGLRSVAGWLAETGHASPSVAGHELSVAARLRSLPTVVEAVLNGQLTQAHAAVLARLVHRIADSELTASQADLVQVATACTPVELAHYVRHLLATHCEPELEADAAAGYARRYLQHSRDADGCLRGRFVLAAEDSEAVLSVLEPLARRAGLDDDRSAGQRRADALVETCEQALRYAPLPDAGGQRPQLSYVLPADWAARQRGSAGCPLCGPRCPAHRIASLADTVIASRPGQVGVPAEHGSATAAWSGPQTRARIEAILCDARISRVLLDAAGQVTGLTALTDSVTAAQRRALAARDGGCTARGCTRPPAFCDAHHLIARADGGPTAVGNLALLCRRHHLRWHQGALSRRDLHAPWLTTSTAPQRPARN